MPARGGMWFAFCRRAWSSKRRPDDRPHEKRPGQSPANPQLISQKFGTYPPCNRQWFIIADRETFFVFVSSSPMSPSSYNAGTHAVKGRLWKNQGHLMFEKAPAPPWNRASSGLLLRNANRPNNMGYIYYSGVIAISVQKLLQRLFRNRLIFTWKSLPEIMPPTFSGPSLWIFSIFCLDCNRKLVQGPGRSRPCKATGLVTPPLYEITILTAPPKNMLKLKEIQQYSQDKIPWSCTVRTLLKTRNSLSKFVRAGLGRPEFSPTP